MLKYIFICFHIIISSLFSTPPSSHPSHPQRLSHHTCLVSLVLSRPFHVVTLVLSRCLVPLSCPAVLSRRLCTHHIHNQFRIDTLVSYHLHHPAHFVLWHSSHIAHFGLSSSHPFCVITYRPFWIITLLWQIGWAMQKLSSDALVTCFLLR